MALLSSGLGFEGSAGSGNRVDLIGLAPASPGARLGGRMSHTSIPSACGARVRFAPHEPVRSIATSVGPLLRRRVQPVARSNSAALIGKVAVSTTPVSAAAIA